VVIIGFTGFAVWIAFAWKGTEFRVNQVTIVDMDATTGTVRGTTWAHVFAPRTQKVTLATIPKSPFSYVTGPYQATSWHGLPGDGFGGLERPDEPSFFAQPYFVDSQFLNDGPAGSRLVAFPLAVWSSRAVIGQWWGTVEWSGPQMALSANQNAELSGTIVNVTPFDLTDAYLVHDRWAIKLGKVDRGSSIQVDGAVGIDLQTLLTQRKVVKGRNVVTPWDPSNTELNRILALMMYYDAAKGRAYTHLEHRFQRELDWSKHLTAGRAVLWGRCRQSAADLEIEKTDPASREDISYCRLLVPVKSRGE
jgi:hypothetical protein